MPKTKSRAVDFVKNISRSDLSIYDPIDVGHARLWIPSPELETILKKGLLGRSLDGLPIRTRSKVVKKSVKHLDIPSQYILKELSPVFLANYSMFMFRNRIISKFGTKDSPHHGDMC